MTLNHFNTITPSVLMRTTILSLFLSLGLFSSAETPYDGLSGANLISAVSREAQSTGRVAKDDLWKSLAAIDVDADGYFINRFSDDKFVPRDDNSEPTGMVTFEILRASWWGDCSEEESPATLSLFNLMPAPVETQLHRYDRPPGRVDRADYDNGFWRTGFGTVYDGVEIEAYEPPVGCRGDFARVCFLFAAVAHPEWPSGLGCNLFTDGFWPYLQPFSAETLMQWHIADPVDDGERRRNEAIFAITGSRNPFVDTPELASYIWGNHANEPFGPNENGAGDDQNNDDDRSPLQAVYTLDASRINLFSPYIPSDAVWSLNGRRLDSDRLVPAELGVGRHELKFESPTARGAVTIEIIR